MTTKETPNKITAVLKVTATAEFFDDEASEETVRCAIEQDLEGDGFNVDVALLKEQEAVEPTFKQDDDGIFVWACGSCGAYMYHIYNGIDKAKEYAKYCRQCGRAVDWNL